MRLNPRPAAWLLACYLPRPAVPRLQWYHTVFEWLDAHLKN
ncbi:MAG: hypothetical protein ACRETS_01565 [Steroidobacteraceae bacterium]